MRKVRRKAGNKDKVFGCDLLEHLNASCQEVPQVLRCCSEFVEHNGIVDGIYRLSGVSSNIQKLRGEFESDGMPDLNKDLYLQDIHCVSSLCKAYFRELPNPLLTYQLYDKFAEAVAIQLEEERLVKIRDVLKELPPPHHRTLEFLMCHLVKMASYSSETNMHARNLAIVWAPNLLRSKDIEASGFNGTAAFMEVRVQSIVVEFILTHVAQLFPDKGVALERRKSLPSPSAAPGHDEGLFKSIVSQTPPNIGNISPGDGPLAIRPYHAIIESTDKRKGSLKGRRWMSIFNIGGRFPDPRRRHKHSSKEKDRSSSLRPARSMDSLSTPSFPNKGSRLPAEASSSSDTPIPAAPPTQAAEMGASTGAIGASEYAVTYRRGTGLVVGGTQGTYTALDPEGLGGSGGEQTRSPGLSSKVGRRAAMHITGPTLVSVPLHITSNLAFGVLQGGGGDRVILRGRDKDGGDRVEGKEVGKKAERKESKGVEKKTEEVRKVDGNTGEKVTGGEEVAAEKEEKTAGTEVKAEQEEKEENEEEVREESKQEEKVETEERCEPRQKRVKSVNSNKGEDNDEDAMDADVEDNEYMEMKMVERIDAQPQETDHGEDSRLVASGILNSTGVEGDDQELSGYVQDSFDFLDQMDCSVLDHMDCSVSHQVNEFSVEPPGHSDDEYEFMEQAQASQHPAEVEQQQTGAEANSQNQSNSQRPLSLDIPNRHTKSLSLPHMTSPIHGPEESSSEEEALDDDTEDEDYSSDDEESIFYKSLPSDFILNSLSGPDTDDELGRTRSRHPVHLSHSSHQKRCDSIEPGPAAVDDEEGEATDEEDKDGLGTEEMTKEEEEDAASLGEQNESSTQSSMTEEHLSIVEDAQGDNVKPPPPETSTPCSVEVLQPQAEGEDGFIEEEKEEEAVDHTHGAVECDGTELEIVDEHYGDFYERAIEQLDSCVSGNEEECDEEEERKIDKELETVTERKENTSKDPTGESSGEPAEKNPEETVEELDKEQEDALCETRSEIWDELEDVVCEVIEDEEAEISREVTDVDAQQVTGGEAEEQTVKVSEEKMATVVEEEATCKKVEVEVVEEHTEIQQDLPRRKLAIEEKDAGGAWGGCDGGNVEDNDKNGSEKIPVPQPRAGEKDALSNEDSLGGVGSKLVTSKRPPLKVYQVKAVPVVPPKPQHCKITALTIRQQQQQRENAMKAHGEHEQAAAAAAAEAGRDGEDEGRGGRGAGERDRERQRDATEEDAMRDANRNSPLSMCFDEAVAIATMRREKEKECERERQRDRGGEA